MERGHVDVHEPIRYEGILSSGKHLMARIHDRLRIPPSINIAPVVSYTVSYTVRHLLSLLQGAFDPCGCCSSARADSHLVVLHPGSGLVRGRPCVTSRPLRYFAGILVLGLGLGRPKLRK
jgi:hypothetical protein